MEINAGLDPRSKHLGAALRSDALAHIEQWRWHSRSDTDIHIHVVIRTFTFT